MDQLTSKQIQKILRAGKWKRIIFSKTCSRWYLQSDDIPMDWEYNHHRRVQESCFVMTFDKYYSFDRNPWKLGWFRKYGTNLNCLAQKHLGNKEIEEVPSEIGKMMDDFDYAKSEGEVEDGEEEGEIDEGKMKELHGYIQDGKSDEEIAKIRKLDVKTSKALMSGYNEEVELDDDGTHVNPKDREELGKAPSDTAKKMKRAIDPAHNQMAEAQSGDKEAYKKFFDAALKKFKVSSPAELKGDQKKKFYDYIDAGWEGDNEKAEGAMAQVREFKIQSMKAALAQVWGMEEGKNPFAEHKGTKPHKHPHEEDQDEENEKRTKTETGKKPAAIDLEPKIKD